jgi:hypothetical protein
MNRFLIQLACAGAIGVLAAAAQAQNTSSSQAVSSADFKAQADASYAAAKSVCEAQGGTARLNCLRSAKADYERWLRNGEVDTSAEAGMAGSGAKGGVGGSMGSTSKQHH